METDRQIRAYDRGNTPIRGELNRFGSPEKARDAKGSYTNSRPGFD